MVDLATLTGAMIIALGLDYAGVFSNDDELADNLLAAGPKVERERSGACRCRRLRQASSTA